MKLAEGFESLVIFVLCREEILVLHQGKSLLLNSVRDCLARLLRLRQERALFVEDLLLVLRSLILIVVSADEVPKQVLLKRCALAVDLVFLGFPISEEQQVLVLEYLWWIAQGPTSLSRGRKSEEWALQHVDALVQTVTSKSAQHDLLKRWLLGL